MKAIRDINKLIIKKIVEIIFVTCFVFFSIFLWQNKSSQVSIATFNSLSYTNFNVENPINYSMYPMANEKAMKDLSPCYITVSNETYTKEDYALVLNINKNSTLDYRFLNISVNEEIYSLNDLETTETNEEITFILARDSIVGDMKDYAIRLWLDSSAGNELQSKKLIMNFDLLKETAKV